MSAEALDAQVERIRDGSRASVVKSAPSTCNLRVLLCVVAVFLCVCTRMRRGCVSLCVEWVGRRAGETGGGIEMGGLLGLFTHECLI